MLGERALFLASRALFALGRRVSALATRMQNAGLELHLRRFRMRRWDGTRKEWVLA